MIGGVGHKQRRHCVRYCKSILSPCWERHSGGILFRRILHIDLQSLLFYLKFTTLMIKIVKIFRYGCEIHKKIEAFKSAYLSGNDQ